MGIDDILPIEITLDALGLYGHDAQGHTWTAFHVNSPVYCDLCAEPITDGWSTDVVEDDAQEALPFCVCVSHIELLNIEQIIRYNLDRLITGMDGDRKMQMHRVTIQMLGNMLLDAMENYEDVYNTQVIDPIAVLYLSKSIGRKPQWHVKQPTQPRWHTQWEEAGR